MDVERIIQAVTLKVIATLDIEEALVGTREELAKWLPADEMILFQMSKDSSEVYLICRIDAGGVRSMDRQSLIKLNEQEMNLRDAQLAGHHEDVVIRRRCDRMEGLSGARLEESLRRFGLPPDADDLILYNLPLNAGIGLLSYASDSYTREHIELFSKLRQPFNTALINAMRYQELRRNRDALIDDNQLFRDVTVCLTGESNIGKAFQNTIGYLAVHLPISQMLLFTSISDEINQQLILRVHRDGTLDEAGEELDLSASADVLTKRRALMDDMPDTFVTELDKNQFLETFAPEVRNSAMTRMGLPQDVPIVVLGVKAAHAAVVFVFEPETTDIKKYEEIIRMLKEPFVIALHNAIRFYELERIRERLQAENRALQVELQKEVGDRVVGMHQGLKQVMELVGQVAKTLSPVLLLGETGSGKEVIATSIHRLSDRNDYPFVSINCGAIPETLIDSELFGHEKGSFTGANERKLGRFERAQGGTLFLDEVGELPPSAQVKLLRVLQEKEFERIGGNKSIQADVRLIAATNRDLPKMVRRGEFREDLWFRLNVFPIAIPPLRERRQDIPALAYFFIESRSRQLNLPYRPSLPAAELDRLVRYDWPGNVRELQNAIERALILSRGEPLHFPHLSSVHRGAAEPDETSSSAAPVRMTTYKEMCRTYFKQLLDTTNGRISGPEGAAVIADINPNTLRSKLKKLGLL